MLKWSRQTPSENSSAFLKETCKFTPMTFDKWRILRLCNAQPCKAHIPIHPLILF